MYNFRIMAKKSDWQQSIGVETQIKLHELGELLSQARQRRGMSVSELAERMNVDRRTLTQLEKGSPAVSFGTFLQALSVLNMLRGIEEVLHPENDIDAMSMSVRRARQRKKTKRWISEKDVDF